MKILDFLLKNPFVLFVLLAWLVPAIANALKKMNRTARPRPPAAPPQQTLPQQTMPQQTLPLPSRASPSPVSPPTPARSAEEVAREMRRILGLDPDPPKPAPRPVAPPPAPPPVRRAPIAPPIERPPQPIQISTRDRKLELHVDPHVGDGIRSRHLDKQKRSATRLGNLGGRAVDQVQRRRTGSRFALDDLKRAIVLSEILAPPVALRPFEERRGH